MANLLLVDIQQDYLDRAFRQLDVSAIEDLMSKADRVFSMEVQDSGKSLTIGDTVLQRNWRDKNTLPDSLKNCNHLQILGCYTSKCLAEVIKDAASKGVKKIEVIEDLCTDSSEEEHEMGLKTIKRIKGVVITTTTKS